MVVHSRDRCDRHGDEGEAQPDGGQQRGAKNVCEVAPVDADLREPEEATGDQRHARGEHRLEAHARDQLRGDPRGEDDRYRQRQVREPRLDRVVAKHLLHVERDEEEHREQGRAREQADDVRTADRPQAEDRERHQRSARTPLDHGERAEQRGREREQQNRPRRSPAGVVGVDERVDEQR